MTSQDDPLDADDDLLSTDEHPVAARADRAVRADDSASLRQVLIEHPETLENFSLCEHLMDRAIREDRPAAVAALLEAGFTANQTDGTNGTLLMTAA